MAATMNGNKDIELGQRNANPPTVATPPLRHSSRTLSFGQRPGREEVIGIARRYIAQCKGNGETEWAKLLEQRLRTFRLIKTKALLELVIYAVEYHSSPGPDGEDSFYSKPKEISNFGDLLQYLATPPEQSMKAQVLSIVQSRGISEESITLVESAHALFDIDQDLFSHAISAMLYTTLASSSWDLDKEQLKGLLDVGGKFTQGHGTTELQLPSNVDPDLVDREEYLQKIPILVRPFLYKSDNTVYTKRPHRRSPRTDWVNVLYSPSTERVPHLRLINSIKCCGKVSDGPIDIPSQYGISDQLPEHATGLTPRYAIGAIASKALLQHCDILNSLRGLTARLEYEGRAHASIAKIDWLLYALDCTKSVISFAEKSLEFPHSWPTDENWAGWKFSYDKDREYVLDSARDVQKELERVREQIKDTLQISMSRRGTLLTILAAIYVPLSFTTGIFGMNISEINDATPKFFHVLALALPLTVVTVLIPLNFGPLWRNSLRLSLRLEDAAKTPFGQTVLTSLEVSLACLTFLFFVLAYAGPLQAVAPYLYPVCLTSWAGCIWFASWARGRNRFWITLLSIVIILGNWIFAFLDFTFATRPVSSSSSSSSSGTWSRSVSVPVTVLSSVFVATPFVLRLLPFLLRCVRSHRASGYRPSEMGPWVVAAWSAAPGGTGLAGAT